MTDPTNKTPRSLSKAKEAVAKIRVADSIDKEADKTLENESVKDLQANRELRSLYANRVYWYLVCYSLAAFILLILHGTKHQGFSMSDTVMGIIVGSTAVSAIGLVGIVVKGLFK